MSFSYHSYAVGSRVKLNVAALNILPGNQIASFGIPEGVERQNARGTIKETYNIKGRPYCYVHWDGASHPTDILASNLSAVS